MPRLTLLALVSVVATALTACGGGGSSTEHPILEPEFLTPVVQSEAAGLQPYWLGTEFPARGQRLALDRVADFYEGPGPSLALEYNSGTGAILSLTTFASESDAQQSLELALKAPGAGPRPVEIAEWSGTLLTLSGGSRPVSNLIVQLDTGRSTVVVQASSVENGVPGDDPNPLIDADLLIDVMAEHLRPYPQ